MFVIYRNTLRSLTEVVVEITVVCVAVEEACGISFVKAQVYVTEAVERDEEWH